MEGGGRREGGGRERERVNRWWWWFGKSLRIESTNLSDLVCVTRNLQTVTISC